MGAFVEKTAFAPWNSAKSFGRRLRGKANLQDASEIVQDKKISGAGIKWDGTNLRTDSPEVRAEWKRRVTNTRSTAAAGVGAAGAAGAYMALSGKKKEGSVNDETTRGILSAVPGLLREQQDEIRTLRAKVASYEARERAEALIERMEERGIPVMGMTRQEKVASILGSSRSMDVIEAAVDISGPVAGGLMVGDMPSLDSSGTPEERFAAAVMNVHGAGLN